MRFHTARSTPFRPADAVFRESRLRATAFGVVMPAMGLVPWWIVWGSSSWAGWLFVALFTVLWVPVSLLLCQHAWQTFHASNWRVRCNAHSLLVNFRTFGNHRLGDDDQVVLELAPRDVQWMRKAVDQATKERSIFLEIKLRDVTGVQQRIDEEIRRPAPRWGSKNTFMGVRLNPDGVLRVEWWSNWTRTVPTIEHLMDLLRTTFPMDAQRTDMSNLAISGDADAQILALVEGGQTLEAIKLVRETYGYSLTEAKEFVTDLRTGSRPGHSTTKGSAD